MSEKIKNKLMGSFGLDDESELARSRNRLDLRFSEKSRGQLIAISRKWSMSMSQVIRQLVAEQYDKLYPKKTRVQIWTRGD